MSRALFRSLPFLAALTLSSCAASIGVTGSHDPDDAAATAAAEEEEEDSESSAKDEEKQARESERKLHFAELDLMLAELDAKQAAGKAKRTVEKAERDVQDAQRDLDLFLNHEAPMQLTEAQLDLDRSEHRRELAQDELNELISMYAAEEFAELTKELVLKRGRKSLEFAERGLELRRQEMALLETEELPKKKLDLELALAKAEHALSDAKVDRKRGAIKKDMALTKARHELEDLRREAEEAEEDDDDEADE